MTPGWLEVLGSQKNRFLPSGRVPSGSGFPLEMGHGLHAKLCPGSSKDRAISLEKMADTGALKHLHRDESFLSSGPYHGDLKPRSCNLTECLVVSGKPYFLWRT